MLRPERPAPTIRTRSLRARGRREPAGRRRSTRRDAATSVVQSSASTTKISSGKSVSGRWIATIAIVTGADSTTAAAIASRSRGGCKAPDPAVDPEDDEERSSARRAGSAAGAGRLRAANSCPAVDESRYADRNETQMIAKSPAPRPGAAGWRGGHARAAARTGILAARPLLQVAEEARELDEDDEADQHADGGDAGVREHVVGERGRAEQRREERQRSDRLLLGEAVVDEPVRGVVGAALGDRPALERPAHGHERRVQDRDREHEQRQQMLVSVAPAVVQLERARARRGRSRAPGCRSRP